MTHAAVSVPLVVGELFVLLGSLGPILPLIILVLLVLFIAGQTVQIVRPHEKGVLERLGTYQRTLEPGLHIVVPFIDRLTKIDMRENIVEVPPQEVITKDNVGVTVDAVVYYEATDPVKLIYNVTNFYMAATKLAQTNLRNVIGEMQLDESLTSREKINLSLRDILDQATDKWGVRIVRVELQRIEPPTDVTQAMHRQMKAERDRRAKILEAEGDRQSAIERAQGFKQSAILEAEGKAQAIREVADAEKTQQILVAQGKAEGILAVYRAIHEGKPTNDLLTVQYLESLQKIADGNATKIFMPLQLSELASGVGAIGELFQSGKEHAAVKDTADQDGADAQGLTDEKKALLQAMRQARANK